MSSLPRPTLLSRHPALDAVRGVAMLFGVVLHAVIPYMQQPVPHLLWPVREPAGPGFDAIYWWIHGFRVQLFFLIAGLLAAASIEKIGPGEFAWQRLARLGVPLMVASIVVVACMMYPVWAWGWVSSGLASPQNVLHVRFAHGMQADLYGLAHLWFVEYLLFYCMILAATRRVRSDRVAPVAPVTPVTPVMSFTSTTAKVAGPRRPLAAVVLLVVATGAWLMLDPRCMIEFHNWFLPRASEFVHHGMFFAAGVAGWSWRRSLAPLGGWWWAPLLSSQAIFPWYLREVSSWSGPGDPAPAVLAACYGWASTLGWLGLALRVVHEAGPVIRFLSARAFWLYLVHPPLVGAVQVLMYEQPVAAWVKFIASFAAAAAVGMLAHGPAARGLTWLKRLADGGPGQVEPGKPAPGVGA